MTAFEAIRRGARRVNSLKRMWIALYAANLLFALVFAAPIFALLYGALGHSVYADQLLKNANIDFLLESAFLTDLSPLVALGPLAIVLCIGYVVFSTFLMGGALTLLTGEPRRFTRAEFYGGCGRWFGRLLAIAALSLVFYGLLMALNGALSAAIGKFFKNGMEERPVAIAGWVRVLFMAVLFGLVNMCFDFAKLHAVLGWNRPVRSGFRFVRTHLGLAARTYALDALLALLFLLAYHGLSELLPQYSMPAVLAAFLLRQAYMVSRIWCRLLFWASEASCVPEPLILLEPVIPTPEPELILLPEPDLDHAVTPLSETQTEL